MKFRKIDIHKGLIFFLFAHLIIWTLVPTISNTNLPLDTIEALAWGTNLDWGYSKHPPVSAWFAKGIFKIFGNQGKHTRFAVGSNSLPMDIAVEIEAIIKIK